jgi:RNA polymerase sigma-70 factor, ECF subfamily
MGSLSETFLAHLQAHAAQQLDVGPALEDTLQALLESAREAWPGLKIPTEDFLAHLADRLGTAPDAARSLALLHVKDLFLAFGCARGDPRAMMAFEDQILPAVTRALIRWDPSFGLVDEVTQVLRQRLLVSINGEPPKIADYSGRGPITKWLRAAAIRTAVSMRRRKPEVALEDEALADWSTPLSDPELDFIKTRYRPEFSGAFRQALTKLSNQERNVLRLHLIDGLNIEQIGNLYQAHRSTVARWIAHSRESLLDETRRLLGEKLRLDRRELESLMGLLRSQIDVSINRFLAKDRE